MVAIDQNVIADLTLFATLTTALATVIYTVGTFLLWSSTNKTTALVRDQLEYQQKQMKSAVVSQVVSSHRDIFLSIVRDENLLKAVFDSKNTQDASKLRKIWMGTILINHCSMMFNEYEASTLDTASYENFKDDANDLFSLPAVRNRWPHVRQFHKKSFSDFIDTEVLGKDTKLGMAVPIPNEEN